MEKNLLEQKNAIIQLREEQKKRIAEYNQALDRRAVELAQDIVLQLREERKRQKLTQKDIAEITGLAAPNIARFEACKYTPSFEILYRYADALGMDINIALKKRK